MKINKEYSYYYYWELRNVHLFVYYYKHINMYGQLLHNTQHLILEMKYISLLMYLRRTYAINNVSDNATN